MPATSPRSCSSRTAPPTPVRQPALAHGPADTAAGAGSLTIQAAERERPTVLVDPVEGLGDRPHLPRATHR